MNENIDLTKILKDVPQGTEFWSPICGDCEFKRIDYGTDFPIVCLAVDKHGVKSLVAFTKQGYFLKVFPKAKCVLFPSRMNYDWSTFEKPKELKEHKQFEPYQKVLRVDDMPLQNAYPWIRVWSCDLYNFYDEKSHTHYFVSGYTAKDDQVLPYEGNENLLGTCVDK